MPPKKEAPKSDSFVDTMFILLVVLFLFIIWSAILNYLFVGTFGSIAGFFHSIAAWFLHYIWPIVIFLSIVVSILCICGIIYNYRRLVKLNDEEELIFGPTKESMEHAGPVVNKNEKWERVIAHLNSPNASDWRLAIIEADIMLDEMLRAQGYHGDSIGDMLKGVEKSDMLTLDAAWEAHKVRNRIAHDGSAYDLNEREVKRIGALYESVFREFKII
jgi:hypothetical protein